MSVCVCVCVRVRGKNKSKFSNAHKIHNARKSAAVTHTETHRQIECDAYISISKCLCALGSLKSYYAYAACTHFACTTITTTTCQAVKLLAINLQQQQQQEKRDLCGLNRYSLGEWAKARHLWHAQGERKRETESATITFNIYNSHAVVPNCVKYVMCVCVCMKVYIARII